MNNECITREDLLERLTLPLGNIAHLLAKLVEEQEDLHPIALKAGLRRALATVEDSHEFLQGLTQTMEERREPRTPDQLRNYVAEKTATAQLNVVSLPLRDLDDIQASRRVTTRPS